MLPPCCVWMDTNSLTLKQRAVNQKPLNRQWAGYVFFICWKLSKCLWDSRLTSSGSYFESRGIPGSQRTTVYRTQLVHQNMGWTQACEQQWLLAGMECDTNSLGFVSCAYHFFQSKLWTTRNKPTPLKKVIKKSNEGKRENKAETGRRGINPRQRLGLKLLQPM